MPFVLDASAAFALAAPDEAAGERTEQRVMTDVAIAPAIWPFELANALRRTALQARHSESQMEALLGILGALDVSLETVDLAQALGSVLDLAREHRLSVYDASYLELAIRRGVPLATVDGALRRAAIEAGVDVLE